jgi:hypothetical protein
VRDLRHQGIAWRVREMDATNIPGARANRCLIFDSEGVVRRAWSFPHSWAELDDASIWALLERELPAPLATARPERRATARGDHGTVVTAARVAANARSVFRTVDEFGCDEIAVSFDENPMEKVGRSRDKMRAAVMNYTATLKAGGVSPERSIVLMKSAVREGLEQTPECADHVAKGLVDEAVTWCIQAYYAS